MSIGFGAVAFGARAVTATVFWLGEIVFSTKNQPTKPAITNNPNAPKIGANEVKPALRARFIATLAAFSQSLRACFFTNLAAFSLRWQPKQMTNDL
jgi:hypothetical protein